MCYTRPVTSHFKEDIDRSRLVGGCDVCCAKIKSREREAALSIVCQKNILSDLTPTQLSSRQEIVGTLPRYEESEITY